MQSQNSGVMNFSSSGSYTSQSTTPAANNDFNSFIRIAQVLDMHLLLKIWKYVLYECSAWDLIELIKNEDQNSPPNSSGFDNGDKYHPYAPQPSTGLRNIILQIIKNIRISSSLKCIYITSLSEVDNYDCISVRSPDFKTYQKLVEKGKIRINELNLTSCEWSPELMNTFSPLIKKANTLSLSWNLFFNDGDKGKNSKSGGASANSNSGAAGGSRHSEGSSSKRKSHSFSFNITSQQYQQQTTNFYKANYKKIKIVEISSGIGTIPSADKLMALTCIESLVCFIKNQFVPRDFDVITQLLGKNRIRKMNIVCYDINGLFKLYEQALSHYPNVEYEIELMELNYSNLLVNPEAKFQLLNRLNIQELKLNCNMILDDFNDLTFLTFFKTLKKLSIKMKIKNNYLKFLTTGPTNLNLKELHLNHLNSNKYDLNFSGFRALKYVTFADCYLNHDILRLTPFLEELELKNCKVNWSSMKITLPQYLNRLTVDNSQFETMNTSLRINKDLTYLSLKNFDLTFHFMNNLPESITELCLTNCEVRYPTLVENITSLKLDNVTGIANELITTKLKKLKNLEVFGNGDLDLAELLSNKQNLPQTLEYLNIWLYKTDLFIIDDLPENLDTMMITIKKLKRKRDSSDDKQQPKEKDLVVFMGCNELRFHKEPPENAAVYIFIKRILPNLKMFDLGLDIGGDVTGVFPQLHPNIESQFGVVVDSLKQTENFAAITELNQFFSTQPQTISSQRPPYQSSTQVANPFQSQFPQPSSQLSPPQSSSLSSVPAASQQHSIKVVLPDKPGLRPSSRSGSGNSTGGPASMFNNNNNAHPHNRINTALSINTLAIPNTSTTSLSSTLNSSTNSNSLSMTPSAAKSTGSLTGEPYPVNPYSNSNNVGALSPYSNLPLNQYSNMRSASGPSGGASATGYEALSTSRGGSTGSLSLTGSPYDDGRNRSSSVVSGTSSMFSGLSGGRSSYGGFDGGDGKKKVNNIKRRLARFVGKA
ncbi:unnamed protein product [Ambrosiozyma monospora]|uniref:Unnamed protein product n=1 Tax=Ambrosiozyma monospora TaxID=43982 RepID=A0A9W6YVK6_AMBMO|nr:unnamed protein product [Ambrosiozyma monospora]